MSFVCVGPELDGLRNIAEKCGTKILQLPGKWHEVDAELFYLNHLI